MPTRTLRYNPAFNAQVLLEQHIMEDWEATDDRGQVSKLKDKTTVTVYPEICVVKISGAERKVAAWEEELNACLGTGGPAPRTESFLDLGLVKGSRPYIEQVAIQTNKSYTSQAYDAASVMARRLTETLIIECFEAHRLAAKIKDAGNNFVAMSDLVARMVDESNDPNGAWNLSRGAKEALGKVKDLGDRSAHDRRYLAKKSDLDGVRSSLRVVVQELITLANAP